MLKWLRKYNTFILVVGGCLLMVAFLLGSVLQDLGKHGLFGGTVFKVGSKRVGQEEYSQSAREYGALSMVVESTRIFSGRQGMAAVGGGENAEHWYLLTHEAEKAGLVGGVNDGKDYMDELARGMASQMARDQSQLDTYTAMFKMGMTSAMTQAQGSARFSDDQMFQAFAKLRGAVRLQNAYQGTARFSARRLASESRGFADQVTVDYVLIPVERELANIPEPTDTEIAAQFAKFKDTPKGGGDFGIGYKLPARVKLTWMELNKDIISSAVIVDGVEVEKRFLQAFPNGQVGITGKTPETERARIEGEVRKELADKMMKAADQIVRAEIDKATHKLDRDTDYLRLPADWGTQRPDFTQIREQVAKRLMEQYKITIPAPKVVVRSNTWIEARDADMLEGIGQAFMRRGPERRPFGKVVFSVREIADSNDLSLQAEVPFADSMEADNGNRYYFMVLDARKQSPPDSLSEIKSDIVQDIKRLAAYDKLKAKESTIRAEAVAQGLEQIAKTPAGSTEPPVALHEATVSKSRLIVGGDAVSQSLDTPAFREKVVNSLSGLDPLVDPAKVDAAAKTFSTPVDQALSLCVYRAKKMLPLTAERFRSSQAGLLSQASRAELGTSMEDSPFTYEAMKKRLNVTDSEGRVTKPDKKDQAAK